MSDKKWVMVPVELKELLASMVELHDSKGTVLTVHMQQIKELLEAAPQPPAPAAGETELDAESILRLWRECANCCNDGNALKFARKIQALTPQAPAAPDVSADKAAGTDPAKCSDDVFKYGVSIGLFVMEKEEAEKYCAHLTRVTGCQHDWHYIDGRVHVKALSKEKPAPDMTADKARIAELEEAARGRMYEPFVSESEQGECALYIALITRLREAERDAKRYRLIRTKLTGATHNPRFFEELYWVGCFGHPHGVDSEIDAAMQEVREDS